MKIVDSSYNPSWLKDAIENLFVYYTPDNVIRKIKTDVVYGNPPYKK